MGRVTYNRDLVLRIRKELGMLQPEFARELSTTTRTISAWENGAVPKPWHFPILYALCCEYETQLGTRFKGQLPIWKDGQTHVHHPLDSKMNRSNVQTVNYTKALMDKYGMTAAEFSDATGIPDNYIEPWQSGDIQPHMDNLGKLYVFMQQREHQLVRHGDQREEKYELIWKVPATPPPKPIRRRGAEVKLAKAIRKEREKELPPALRC